MRIMNDPRIGDAGFLQRLLDFLAGTALITLGELTQLLDTLLELPARLARRRCHDQCDEGSVWSVGLNHISGVNGLHPEKAALRKALQEPLLHALQLAKSAALAELATEPLPAPLAVALLAALGEALGNLTADGALLLGLRRASRGQEHPYGRCQTSPAEQHWNFHISSW
jgi:hypothetical protein